MHRLGKNGRMQEEYSTFIGSKITKSEQNSQNRCATSADPHGRRSVHLWSSRNRRICFRWPESLTLVAPFINEVESAFEERVVGGRGDSGERQDGGAELRGWSVEFALRVGFVWVRWDRGKNEVIGVGKLPGVVGGRADEVAANADRVFLGVEIN